MGPYKLNRFCEHLNLSGLHQKSFKKRDLHSNMIQTGNLVFTKSATIVRNIHKKSIEDSRPLDVAVSFDGTWLTRGHSSLIGLSTVIEVETGLVLDLHVNSLHCSQCASRQNQAKSDPDKHKKWLEEHKQTGCSINYKGTSGMMEADAVGILWSHSLTLHNFRYTTMVGDGDSKAYDKVQSFKPYGADVEINKEECMNHVAKRLGTALRNVAQESSKKVTLGGKKAGSLTAEKIKRLCIFYNRALRGNKIASEMKKAIMASLYHNYATNDDCFKHQFCPIGKDSWCFFKRDLAEGVFPKNHQKRIHCPLNHTLLHKYMLPIYERLSDIKLLRRCEIKATQNRNESLHSLIWSRCAKSQFHSKTKVEYSAISAIAEFNFGPVNSIGLNKIIGLHSLRLCTQRQVKRLQSSKCALSEKQKERQKKRKNALERAAAEYRETYGTTGYGAGQF